MTTIRRSFARAALATLITMITMITMITAVPAAAAPQQSDVLPPGGFVATCAASASGANYLAYGGHLAANWSNSAYDGKYACNSQSFSGADGSGVASAGFVAPNIANTAQGRASMGLVQLAATNSSPANTFFAQGAANGGWSDSSVVAIDGLSGGATWLFDVEITGALSTLGGSAAFAATAYKNEVELSRYVAGFDPGGSDSFTTDAQRVRWRLTAANNGAAGSLAVSDIVTFAVPVTLGTPFVWGAFGGVFAAQRAATTGDTRIVTAEVEFPFTMRYAGSHGVLVDGVLHEDYTLASASGIDWRQATAVPEPTPASLLLAGLAAVAWWARRRSQQPKAVWCVAQAGWHEQVDGRFFLRDFFVFGDDVQCITPE
jgi:hypothetical protein